MDLKKNKYGPIISSFLIKNYKFSIFFQILNSDFRNLNVENGKLKSSKRLNETLWSTESEKLKSRIFDMESELKNLQYELLAKEEILRNSVAVSDITEVQEQNEIISNKVHFIKKKDRQKLLVTLPISWKN